MFERDTHSTIIFHERLLFECTYGLVLSPLWAGVQNSWACVKSQRAKIPGNVTAQTRWFYVQFERPIQRAFGLAYVEDIHDCFVGDLFSGADDAQT